VLFELDLILQNTKEICYRTVISIMSRTNHWLQNDTGMILNTHHMDPVLWAYTSIFIQIFFSILVDSDNGPLWEVTNVLHCLCIHS
jgi:hypothetical protein